MTTTSVPLAATRAKRGPRSSSSKMHSRRQRVGWVFVAPFAVVFVVFLLFPLLYAFWLSLRTQSLATGDQFAGFANYARAFTDPEFLSGVGRVLVYAVILIPIQMVLAACAALVLDTLTSRFAKIARLAIFVPYAVPVVIGALMWGFLYSPTFGPIAQIFGPHAPSLLTDSGIYVALTNIVTWQWSGYYMIIIYAALQAIDPSIYEAAKLDGANGWQTAVRIKLPMVSSSFVLILVFAIIGTLQFFTEPQVLHNVASGVITPSYTPNMYAYNLAFQYNQFGYASAISFALGLVVFIGSYLFLYSTRKRSGLQ